MRLLTLFVMMCVLARSTSAGPQDTSATTSKTPTVAENFSRYCQQPDASVWYCQDRKMMIPDSQKWDIVGGYCFDSIGVSRPDDKKQIDVLLAALRADAATAPRAAVCEEYKRVIVPMALEYNHRQGQWSDTNGGFEARKRTIELDPVLLIPIAHLAKDDHVGVVIKETNPMLFVANRGEAKEENIDQVKGLEQLLAFLGPAFTKALADVTLAADAASANRLTLQQRIDRLSSTDAVFERAARDEAADGGVFLSDLEKIKGWTRAADTALGPVKIRLKRLIDQRAWLQAAAQRLESGPVALEGTLDRTLEDPASWRTLFKTLEEDSGAIKSLAGCAPVLDAFIAVVSAKTEEPATVSSSASRFTQFFNNGSQAPDPGVCAELDYDARLLVAVEGIQAAAQPAVRQPSDTALIKALRDAHAGARERHLEMVFVLQRVIGNLDASRQGIKEVMAKEEDTRKASLVLGLMGARARDAAVRIENGRMLLTNRIYVMDEIYGSSATKVRTTPLKIVVNSQNSESVPTERPKEVTTSYRFVRRGFDRLSFGVGALAYATAASVTYTVVDPDPSTNQATTTTTTVTPVAGTTQTTTVSRPELKVIREKERQPRTGTYVLFANQRAFGSASAGAGVQFGAATSSDNPAFLFGLSLNLGRVVTVGMGGGRFRVKELAADQRGADVRVLNVDEIRLDTNWIWSRYLSIGVNLSGLPLFK